MSDNTIQTPAEILISSAVKTVGKREFLKTVEKMFGKVKQQSKQKLPVSQETQCQARVKGDRTGLKIGRHVLFESLRCDRAEVDSITHFCKIHSNQIAKLGELPYGRATQELSDELRKTFV